MRRLTLVAGVCLLMSPGAAWAQNPGLSGLLLRFFAPSNPVILADTGHSAHFGSQPGAQATLLQLNAGIASQIATFPLGSSSGGFSYVFDPALGVFSRATESFGPLFAERALSLGKGKVTFGSNYSRLTFDAFEGENLRNGDIKLFLKHVDTNGDNSNLDPFFEGDLITADLFLNIKAETTAFFASYGVSDRIDVGFALPYIRLDIDARIQEGINRLSTDTSPFLFHIFTNGTSNDVVRQRGSAEGLGDLVLRGKYLFKKSGTGGIAMGVDLRLPTGDENELLGSGATQAKVFAIASGGGGRFSPHVNAGYTFSRGGSLTTGELPDEINYTLGFDAVLSRRLTLTGDVIGRTLRDTNRIVKVEQEYKYRHGNNGDILTSTITDFASRPGDLNVLLGSVGLKANPGGRLLLSANLLFSTGKRGLQDYLTPVFAIDYSF